MNDNYSAASGQGIYAGRFNGITAHVFIESGQSNCQGVAPVSQTPIPTGQLVGNIKTWRRGVGVGSSMYSGTGQWLGLQYSTNQYEGRNQFGSVLKFAMHLRDNLEDANNQIYIIKADGNGKPITGWMSGGNENIAMYQGHIQPALADLMANPAIGQIRIHGFFWDQGEYDAKYGAAAYYANLATLISDVRAFVGIPNLPFIHRKLGSEIASAGYPHVEVVRTAQDNAAANIAGYHIIDSTPYTYVADNVHIDGPAQNEIGDLRYSLLSSITQNGYAYNG